MSIVDDLREAGLRVRLPHRLGGNRADHIKSEPSGVKPSNRAERTAELQAAADAGAMAVVDRDGAVTLLTFGPVNGDTAVIVGSGKRKQDFSAEQKDAIAALTAVLKGAYADPSEAVADGPDAQEGTQ